MRRLVCLVLLWAAGTAYGAQAGTAVGEKIARFQAGTHDSHKPARPTAYVFLGTTCPTTQKYVGRIAALEKAFGRKIAFVYLYPNVTDTADAKKAHFAKLGLSGLFFDDQGAKIAQLVGAARTTEVIVVDKKARIVYRGAIDDDKDESKVKRRHLALALEELLAGKKIGTPKTEVHA
jgi:hypothetical protein